MKNFYIKNKNNGEEFLVVKYICRIIEKGTDTDFTNAKIEYYNPLLRNSVKVQNNFHWELILK